MKLNYSVSVPTYSQPHRPSRGWAALAFASLLVWHSASAQPAATTAAPAAKSDQPVVLEQVTVSSVRGALVNAQELKQNAIPLIDSIVAEDVGKFPDNTVADALQHVPGIQVSRGSGEIGGVVIRGLPNVGTTLNGNEIFTGTGRGVALQDIPAELVAGVDVYKSTSPELIEGGIAGLIDIRLRRPFDFNKPVFALNGRLIHSRVYDKNGYVASVLASNRVKTGAGEVGVLYSGAYQKRYWIDQTAFNFLFEPQPVPAGLVAGQTTLELPFTQGSLLTPYQRTRWAHDLSLQWKVNNELEVYDDFLNTEYRDKHQVHFLIGFPRFGAYTAATTVPNTDVPITTTSTNNFHLTSMQAFQQRTDGFQNVLGLKWGSGDTKVMGEYVYNWNKFKNQVLIVDTRFGPSTPGTFKFTYSPEASLAISGVNVLDPANYYLWGLFDNHDVSTSEQNGLRAQIEHSLPGVFQKIIGGVRWSKRDVAFRGTSRNDVSPAGATGGDRFAATVPKLSTIPNSTSSNPKGTLSYYGTPYWLGANPDWLYSSPDAVRALFGLPAGPAQYNPTLGFTDTETVFAGYLDTKFSAKLGGYTLDGTVGARIAGTSQDLQGYRTDGTPINSSKTQNDVLPVLNSRLKITDELQLRFAAGRTITRPEFGDLNPAVTLNAPTTTGGAAGTGSGGNPDLNTVKSNNYDLSLEYYFGKADYAALTGFYRDIDGYVQSFAARETINNVNYNVVRPRNSGKGHLEGFELTYQQFPKILHGLGWTTNYTYIEGDTDAPDASPGAAVGARVRKPYAQVARHNINAILIYELGNFSARLAYTWRGQYTDTFDGPNAAGSPLRQIFVKPTKWADFEMSYAFTPNFTVTFDATNILKTKYHDFFYDASRYPRDTRASDQTYELGLRYRY